VVTRSGEFRRSLGALTTKTKKRRKGKNMSATETKKATAATSETIAELFQTHPSLGQIKDKPAYTVALVCLLSVWPIFSLATAILVVAVLAI
jgi:hypothetical protein